MTFHSDRAMSGRAWTKEEDDLLIKMYPTSFAGEIRDILGRSLSSIYCRVSILGMKSSPEKIRRAGMISASHPNNIASRFKKGHIPANKGSKMSPEIYARCAGTMFKKGHISNNKRDVGSERVNREG